MGDFFFHIACRFPLLMSGTDAAKTVTACGWLGAYSKPHFFCNSLGQFVMMRILIARVWFCYSSVLRGHQSETSMFPPAGLGRPCSSTAWMRPRAPWPFTWPRAGWSQKRGLHALLRRSHPPAPKWVQLEYASMAGPGRLGQVTPEASSRDLAWQPRIYKRHSQELPEGFILLWTLSWSCRMPPAPRIWTLQGPFGWPVSPQDLVIVCLCVSLSVFPPKLCTFLPSTFTSYSCDK